MGLNKILSVALVSSKSDIALVCDNTEAYAPSFDQIVWVPTSFEAHAELKGRRLPYLVPASFLSTDDKLGVLREGVTTIKRFHEGLRYRLTSDRKGCEDIFESYLLARETPIIPLTYYLSTLHSLIHIIETYDVKSLIIVGRTKESGDVSAIPDGIDNILANKLMELGKIDDFIVIEPPGHQKKVLNALGTLINTRLFFRGFLSQLIAICNCLIQCAVRKSSLNVLIYVDGTMRSPFWRLSKFFKELRSLGVLVLPFSPFMALRFCFGFLGGRNPARSPFEYASEMGLSDEFLIEYYEVIYERELLFCFFVNRVLSFFRLEKLIKGVIFTKYEQNVSGALWFSWARKVGVKTIYVPHGVQCVPQGDMSERNFLFNRIFIPYLHDVYVLFSALSVERYNRFSLNSSICLNVAFFGSMLDSPAPKLVRRACVPRFGAPQRLLCFVLPKLERNWYLPLYTSEADAVIRELGCVLDLCRELGIYVVIKVHPAVNENAYRERLECFYPGLDYHRPDQSSLTLPDVYVGGSSSLGFEVMEFGIPYIAFTLDERILGYFDALVEEDVGSAAKPANFYRCRNRSELAISLREIHRNSSLAERSRSLSEEDGSVDLKELVRVICS